MIVLKQNARFGVYRNINIRPAIIIEVIRHRSNGITRARFQNAGLFGDVGKRAIAIVAIQNVGVAGKTPWPAHDGHALPLAVVRRAGRRNLVWIKLNVVADEKIKVAVTVIVEKCAAGPQRPFS